MQPASMTKGSDTRSTDGTSNRVESDPLHSTPRGERSRADQLVATPIILRRNARTPTDWFTRASSNRSTMRPNCYSKLIILYNYHLVSVPFLLLLRGLVVSRKHGYVHTCVIWKLNWCNSGLIIPMLCYLNPCWFVRVDSVHNSVFYLRVQFLWIKRLTLMQFIVYKYRW